MHKKHFQNLQRRTENWHTWVWESKNNVFSLFFKLGNSYFCIIMEVNRERRIKDGTEKGEGEKRGERENIHNFIWKANNKVGSEITNFVSFLVFLIFVSYDFRQSIYRFCEWPLPASLGTLPSLGIYVLHSAQLLQPCPTLRRYGLQPDRLLCPWGFLGKDTGVGCHALLQGIFPTQGLNLHLLMSTCFGRLVLTISAIWEAPGLLKSHT